MASDVFSDVNSFRKFEISGASWFEVIDHILGAIHKGLPDYRGKGGRVGGLEKLLKLYCYFQ